MDFWAQLAEWQRKLPAEAVFACATAAWIHRLVSTLADPIEIILPWKSTIRSRPPLTVHRSDLDASEKTVLRDLRLTTLPRTLRDVSLFGARLDALILIDAALFKTVTNKPRLLQDPVTSAGRRGAGRLRQLIALAEPAESPMETRLRWLLKKARLPRPEVQRKLYDGKGDFVGRADLYYPTARLVVEFDGGNHRDRLVTDDRRQNLLFGAGFRVLRFTSADIYQRPEIVEAQVRNPLAA
jgi:very-short-patch-repair endonuclease